MSEILNWDVAAANNNDPAPDGFPEGMAYSEVNDSSREVMAAIAREEQDTNGTIGTVGAGLIFTATADRTFTLADGVKLAVKFNVTTGAGVKTLDVNGLGARTLYLPDGETLFILEAGGIYLFVYNTTLGGWQLLSTLGREQQLATINQRGTNWSIQSNELGTVIEITASIILSLPAATHAASAAGDVIKIVRTSTTPTWILQNLSGVTIYFPNGTSDLGGGGDLATLGGGTFTLLRLASGWLLTDY